MDRIADAMSAGDARLFPEKLAWQDFAAGQGRAKARDGAVLRCGLWPGEMPDTSERLGRSSDRTCSLQVAPATLDSVIAEGSDGGRIFSGINGPLTAILS